MNQEDYGRSDEPQLWEMTYEAGHPECKHTLPGDWEFGGPTNEDPRADPRWRPVLYVYLDRMLRTKHMTNEPMCLHQAIGSYREKISKRVGVEIFYVIASEEDKKGETIYSDTEGAVSAS